MLRELASKSLVGQVATQLIERLVMPVMLVVCAFELGTVGFLIMGQGHWSLLDCAYMTSITLTTVGYGEVLEKMGPDARVFAMMVMWAGMGVTLYALSTVTAFVVEKNLVRIIRERQMEKRIAALNHHVILCGAGQIGIHILKELSATRHDSVVIEHDTEKIEWIKERYPNVCVLRGDATEEDVLRHAGIERASGIIAALREDSANMLITVQARFVNHQIKIVSRCNMENLGDKFYRAGADYVVNPASIGGMRMASEMIRPHVVTFLDRMLRGKDSTIRVEEILLDERSPLVGVSLGDAAIPDRTGLVVIAMKHPDEYDFRYNLNRNEVLKARTVIIVIGSPEQIRVLRDICEAR